MKSPKQDLEKTHFWLIGFAELVMIIFWTLKELEISETLFRKDSFQTHRVCWVILRIQVSSTSGALSHCCYSGLAGGEDVCLLPHSYLCVESLNLLRCSPHKRLNLRLFSLICLLTVILSSKWWSKEILVFFKWSKWKLRKFNIRPDAGRRNEEI